jgi:hypothetical protein
MSTLVAKIVEAEILAHPPQLEQLDLAVLGDDS